MGSFDGVCGLSRMAIGSGDPVVAMMIRTNPWSSYESSPIYPYDVWQPATVLSRGHYADYGNVDLADKGAAWAKTQEAAKSWYKRTWYPAGESNGRPYSGSWRMAPCRLTETFEATGERPDMREDREDEGNDKSGPLFAIWMAHEAIWDHLINTVQVEYSYKEDKGKSVKQLSQNRLDKNHEAMAGKVPDRYKDLFDGLPDDEKSKRLIRSLRLMDDPWKVGSSEDNSPVADFISEAIWDAHDAKDMAAYDELTQHWLDSTTLFSLLYQMRCSVTPPGTIGPQHGHDQPFLMLGEAIAKQAKLNLTKYEEFDDDEEDDVVEPGA